MISNLRSSHSKLLGIPLEDALEILHKAKKRFFDE